MIRSEIELLAAADDRDLLATHTHQEWIPHDRLCPRCHAEWRLLAAARARLEGEA
jgi:hypothetical protein